MLTTDVEKRLREIHVEAVDALSSVKARMDQLEAHYQRPDAGRSSGNSGGFCLSETIWHAEQFKAFAKTGRGRIAIPVSGSLLECKTAITTATLGTHTP